MSIIARLRHTFHYSSFYLYWCIVQIVGCLTLICLFFVDLYNDIDGKYLFAIELSIFIFMLLDVLIFFALFGCKFNAIIIVELALIIFSGLILMCLVLDHFKKIVEEYDSILMVTRVFIQMIRMTILGFKTSDSKKKKDLSEMNLELDGSFGEKEMENTRHSAKSFDGNMIYLGDSKV